MNLNVHGFKVKKKSRKANLSRKQRLAVNTTLKCTNCNDAVAQQHAWNKDQQNNFSV